MPLVCSSMRPGATMAPPRSTVLSPLDDVPSTILPVSSDTTRCLCTSLPPSHTRQFAKTVVAMIGRGKRVLRTTFGGLQRCSTCRATANDNRWRLWMVRLIPYLSVAVLSRLKWTRCAQPRSRSTRRDLLIAGHRSRSAKSRRRHRVCLYEHID